MAKVVALGETMAALTPGSSGALRYVTDYRIRIAGAESNVAVGLSKLGIETAWISRVGEDELGYFVRNQIRSEGVDCREVIFDPEHRTGLMLKETGALETKVFYYRENSAASHLSPKDLKEEMLQQAELLYLTGITPVLSESCERTVREAIRLGKKHGLLISFDPNVRKKLWKERDYGPLLARLALESDIVLLGLSEAEILFGETEPDASFDLLFREGGVRYAAIKNGAEGAWAADRSRRIAVKPYPCRSVDPIGAGDGFNAGFLAGILLRRELDTAGKMGAICGALATQTTGDVEGYPDRKQMENALSQTEEIYR